MFKKMFFVFLAASAILQATQYAPLPVDEDEKLPTASQFLEANNIASKSYVTSAVAAVKPAVFEVGIDLGEDYTEFEVKVMTPANVCVYFYSTIRAAMTGGYGAAHPSVTDTGGKVIVLSVTKEGTDEDRLPYIYTYDTTGESYGSMLDYFDIGGGWTKATTNFNVVKFRPDMTKAWVREAFLNPQNYVIYWRQTIATGETITSGETVHKVWRLGILTPVFGN